MGKNKLKKFAEMDTFSHVFQYPYKLLQNKNFPLRGVWAKDFFKNDKPIILELGCGKGEYAVALAQQYPDHNFIAIDIKGARMWSGAKESLEKGLQNIAFIRTNIEILPLFFGEQEVSQIWITFPDPQMKKFTKRLTATPFIERYRRLLQKDGWIHLKTDSPFLFQYTSEMVAHNKLACKVSCKDLYQDVQMKDDPILGIKTFYEQQWLSRGKTIKYICFSPHTGKALSEPELEVPHDDYRSFGRMGRV